MVTRKASHISTRLSSHSFYRGLPSGSSYGILLGIT